MQNTQFFQPQKAMEFLGEATQAAADFSAKTISRQADFARKMAGRDFSWREFWDSPAEGAAAPVRECIAFARESAEEAANASERGCDIVERALTVSVEQAQAFMPPKSEPYGRQLIENIRVASAAVKSGVRASYSAASAGLRAGEENAAESADTAQAATVVRRKRK